MSTNTIENEIYSYDDDIINQENIEEYSSTYTINTLSTDEDDIGRLATIKTFSDYFHKTLSGYTGLTGDEDFDFDQGNDAFNCETALNTMLHSYNNDDSNRIITYKHLLDLYGDMFAVVEITGIDEYGNTFGSFRKRRTTFFEKAPNVKDSELQRAVKLDTSLDTTLGRKQFEDYIIFNESTVNADNTILYGCIVDVYDETLSE